MIMRMNNNAFASHNVIALPALTYLCNTVLQYYIDAVLMFMDLPQFIQQCTESIANYQVYFVTRTSGCPGEKSYLLSSYR